MTAPAPQHVLLDPERARVCLNEAGVPVDEVVITYRRVLEDHGVVAYRLHGHDGSGAAVSTFGYARWAPPDRLAAMADKWLAGRAEPGPFGEGVRMLPGLDALLFLSPNDRALRLLPHVVDLARLKRLLAPLPSFEPAGFRIREKRSAIEVLRYKPEQRLVARARLGLVNEADETRTHDVIVRLFADDRGRALAANVTAWREAGAGDVLPEPLGALADGSVHVETAVRGDTLRQAIRDSAIAPARMAEAITTLHAARPSLPTQRTGHARLAVAQDILTTLATHGVPETAAIAQALAAHRPAERSDTPVHGDLHARQVLVHEGTPVFVDFERAAMGDPLDDVGNLLAHLEWEHATMGAEGGAAGPFAAALARELATRKALGEPRALAFFTACAFVEIAELPVRRRVAGSAELAARALALARAHLGL